MFNKLHLRTVSEAADILLVLMLKRDQMRKLYREIESDKISLDWNTQGELLVELAAKGVDYNQMIESILTNLSLHVFPFDVVDRR